MAFDECTPYPCDYDYAKRSMHMTHRWLKRCCDRFDSTEEKYGHIKNKQEWVMFIYGFLDRVRR